MAMPLLGFRPPHSSTPVAALGGRGEGDFARLLSPYRDHNFKKITSVSNPLVKHCVKLRLSSSYRRSCRSLLLVGLTPILEICSFQKVKELGFSTLDCLLLLDGTETPVEFHGPSGLVVHVTPVVMKKLSGMQSIGSIEAVAIMKIPPNFFDLECSQDESIPCSLFHSSHRILVLDGIQDPGNLGTLIRSACAFKWDCVFLLPDCCDPFNEKALRASRGASFQLPVISGNWAHIKALIANSDMRMLAAQPEKIGDGCKRSYSLSRELADMLSSKPLCLVLGSEGSGLSEQSLEACEPVSIPMEGMFESLNVSVAGGIFLFMLQPKHSNDRR